jgi:tetratricopeptide (TPR) repeat protein
MPDALIFNFMSQIHRQIPCAIAVLRFALGLALLCSSLVMQAQTATENDHRGSPHEEVQKKMNQRDWPGALQEIDEYLQERPRDPQMRFWRARMLEVLQRKPEALQVYRQLSEEYPELPEVQNNLGVMLAADGQIDEAKRAFELALRNNPTYAIAHENLGDIFLHLAQRSYLNAQKHGAKSAELKAKMQALQPVLQLTLPKP